MWRLLEVGEKVNADTDETFMFTPNGCEWGAVDPEIDEMEVVLGKWPIRRKISETEESCQLPTTQVKTTPSAPPVGEITAWCKTCSRNGKCTLIPESDACEDNYWPAR